MSELWIGLIVGFGLGGITATMALLWLAWPGDDSPRVPRIDSGEAQ